MRIAIISDIHGNKEALETALEDIRQRAPDRIVCLGDIVGYGANPVECLAAVREATPYIVLGNHDEAIFDPSKREHFAPMAREAIIWTSNQLAASDRNFLAGLPYRLRIDEFLFVHATPEHPEEWDYIFGGFEARLHSRAFTERVCFVGHSHIPAVYSMTAGTTAYNGKDRFIINVGSIGQPRDGNPDLSYGIVDSVAGTYENIRLRYDVKAAVKKILANGLPQRLAHRLLEGR